MKKNNMRRYGTLLLITAGLNIWNIVYLPSYYYVPFQTAFEYTNQQMGQLLSMYGVLAVLGYLFGGFMADKFSPKILMILSSLLTAGLGLVMTTYPSYSTMLLIYMGFGVTAVFLYWSAFVKSIRMMGTDAEQGKLFGAFEAFYGLTSIIFSNVILIAFSSYIEAGGNFEYVIMSYCGISAALAVLIFFLFKPEKIYVAEHAQKGNFSFKLIPQAFKYPVTWFNSIIVFALFLILSGANYLNPYLHDVFLMPVTWATAMGIIIKFGFRIVMSPIGGVMVDRAGSCPKVLILSSALTIISGIVLALIPGSPNLLLIAVVMVFVFCISFNLARSGMYVPVAEVKVPIEILGTVVGIVSAVGYSSDIYIWTFFGYLLDTYGNTGYNYVMYMMVGAAVLTLVTSILYGRYLTKIRSAETTTQSVSTTA